MANEAQKIVHSGEKPKSEEEIGDMIWNCIAIRFVFPEALWKI